MYFDVDIDTAFGACPVSTVTSFSQQQHTCRCNCWPCPRPLPKASPAVDQCHNYLVGTHFSLQHVPVATQGICNTLQSRAAVLQLAEPQPNEGSFASTVWQGSFHHRITARDCITTSCSHNSISTGAQQQQQQMLQQQMLQQQQ